MNTHDWQTFALPGFALQFQYPPTTPDAHPVDMDEIRVHVRSRDSAAVYFEVSRHLHLAAEAVYEREKGFVTAQLGGDVTPLQATTLAGQPAQEYSFAWADKGRVVLVIEHQEYTYRFIYDPRSPINQQVLATIEIVE